MDKRPEPEGQEPVDEESSGDEEIICTHLQNPFPSTSKSEPSFKTKNEAKPSSSSKSSSSSDPGSGSNLGAEAVKTAAVASAAGVAVPVAATAGLTAAGFTGTGIAAGSVAAASQAAIGNVAAGSLFATLQSVGATGGFAILGPVGLGAAAVAGGAYAGYRLWNNSTKKDNNAPGENAMGVRKMENKDTKADPKQVKPKGKSDYYVNGVNICEDCWLRMQVREYKRLSKQGLKLSKDKQK